jgi:hypothetical protein
VIVPSVLPAATVNTVVPRLSVPPFSALTLEVAPFKFSTPPLTLVTDAAFVTPVTPPLTLVLESVPAFTTPPLMSLVKRPATFTVPRLSPPVIVAFDANRVFPAPLNPANVVVPVAPVKYTLFDAVFRLLTAPRLKPVPLIVANPLAFTLSVAAPL